MHLVAILTIVFFAFMAISSGATTPAVTASDDKTLVSTSSTVSSKGVVHDIPDPSQKRFNALGLVFAKSESNFDENGLEISSQEGIVNLLLREAQKLGGDDILNFRVDESVTFVKTQVTSNNSTKTTTTKTVTYTGSALAIKYIDN